MLVLFQKLGQINHIKFLFFQVVVMLYFFLLKILYHFYQENKMQREYSFHINHLTKPNLNIFLPPNRIIPEN